MSAGRRQRGVILLVVLFFVLLLASSIATFLRRVAMDAGAATQRDRALQAEALARGGVRLAGALLLEDLRLDADEQPPDTLRDAWARVGEVDLAEDPDVSLRLHIEDAAARLNLNSLAGGGAGGAPAAPDDKDPKSALGGGEESPLGGEDSNGDAAKRVFLQELLVRVIEQMPGRPEEKRYDPAVLVDNLIDWVDADEVRQSGGDEDEPYQARTPPHRAANRPLLSLDELRLVEGFDGRLVEALRPYVGVYPLVGGGGLNLNTAPSWVLAQLQRGTDVSGMRPVEADDVRRVIEAREEGYLCGPQAQGEGCIALAELFEGESIEPPATERSQVFLVRAVARVFDVERTIETAIDRSEPAEPVRLSWRVR
jgi:general secretion pathway protein K